MSRTDKDRPINVQAWDATLRCGHWYGLPYRDCDGMRGFDYDLRAGKWDRACQYQLTWFRDDRSHAWEKRTRSKARRRDIRVQLTELIKSRNWEEADIAYKSKILHYWELMEP